MADAAAASHLQEASATQQATAQPPQLPQCMEPRPLGQGWGQGETATGGASLSTTCHSVDNYNLPALHTQSGWNNWHRRADPAPLRPQSRRLWGQLRAGKPMLSHQAVTFSIHSHSGTVRASENTNPHEIPILSTSYPKWGISLRGPYLRGPQTLEEDSTEKSLRYVDSSTRPGTLFFFFCFISNLPKSS